MTLRKLYTRYWKLENSLWKRLSKCRKTDYGMNVVHFKAKSPFKEYTKKSAHISEKTHWVFITKTSLSTLFRIIIAL